MMGGLEGKKSLHGMAFGRGHLEVLRHFGASRQLEPEIIEILGYDLRDLLIGL